MWAVGSAGPYTATIALTEHWDGSQWSVIPVPAAANDIDLHSVAAVSANDVWAVGEKGIIHWDGTAWSVSQATQGWGDREYFGVAAGPNAVWAVGRGGSVNHEQVLIEQWNGQAWIVSLFEPPFMGVLRSVAQSGPNDAWAVGYYGLPDGPVVEHWNGYTWAASPLPEAVSRADFESVVAIAANDVWAVGSSVIHWDGSTWSVVPTPPWPAGYGSLTSVTAFGSNDVWAVGSSDETLIEHWDGHAWSIVPGPEAGLIRLNGVIAVGSDTLWAVGASGSYPSDQPLVARYGPAAPFVDVPPGSPFYTDIYCLVCQGIVGGYDDNSFRPGNPVTRGQFAKFVANAAGYTEPITIPRQTFTDVPPDNPFWRYIERVAAHGVVGGYSNGNGTFSFRPDAPVTRGQAAKFVANAAQFGDIIPPAQQSFSDVPPADPFWLFVERVYAHRVISGYADGTFRARAAVTRGQTAKFIANSLVPACRIDQH
jgi:hypothetical protein